MYDLIVIGGGAAGFFCAINYAEKNNHSKILILEASNKVLSKVRISGGGRCNVTNACSEPKELVKNYPRGEKELLGPFTRFNTTDTVTWFEDHGVPLKTEEDGRIFPKSNQSESIIHCLLQLCSQYNIEIQVSTRVSSFHKEEDGNWRVNVFSKEYFSTSIFVASGGDTRIWDCLEELGHSLISPVPSLFTFNILDKQLKELSGISVPNATVDIIGTSLTEKGPLLITHWGMSGPVILRLSAWGAKKLFDVDYKFGMQISWVDNTPDEINSFLKNHSNFNSKKSVHNQPTFNIPQRLWKYLCIKSGIAEDRYYQQLNSAELKSLSSTIVADNYKVEGKSTFKEEFVTAGGIDLKNVNFKTFESRVCPGLYFAGEVLNIDGITGGFNFQAAWTGGWIAAQAIVASYES